MNIFVTDEAPFISATSLDLKRIPKMALESAQLLSTAIHYHAPNSGVVKSIYKPSYINHPCSCWTRQSTENYFWLYEHYIYLCELYEEAFGRQHASFSLNSTLYKGIGLIPNGSLSKFVNCTRNKELGIDFSEIIDTTQAYKAYLCARWLFDKTKPRWIYGQPVWARNSLVLEEKYDSYQAQ